MINIRQISLWNVGYPTEVNGIKLVPIHQLFGLDEPLQFRLNILGSADFIEKALLIFLQSLESPHVLLMLLQLATHVYFLVLLEILQTVIPEVLNVLLPSNLYQSYTVPLP